MLRILIVVAAAALVLPAGARSDEAPGSKPESVAVSEPATTLTPYLHLLSVSSPLPYLPPELPRPSFDLGASLRERTFRRDAEFGFELGAEVYRDCRFIRGSTWNGLDGLRFGGHMRRMQYLSHDLSYRPIFTR